MIISKAGATVLVASCVVACTTTTAAADSVTYNDALGMDFFPGLGNTNTNFVINRVSETGGNTIELALKTKKRQGADGATPSYGDGVYSVQPGSQAGNPNRWWWNFEYSIALGDRTLANTDLVLNIDFDNDAVPAQSIDLNALFAGDDSDVFAESGIANLFQNSKNFAFTSEFGTDYDRNAVGTYTFELVAYDSVTAGELGAVTMRTVVVPLPSGAGMALAGVGMIGLRRRR